MQILLLIFLPINSTCFFQFRWESIRIPRYLIDYTLFNCLLHSLLRLKEESCKFFWGEWNYSKSGIWWNNTVLWLQQKKTYVFNFVACDWVLVPRSVIYSLILAHFSRYLSNQIKTMSLATDISIKRQALSGCYILTLFQPSCTLEKIPARKIENV